MSYISQTVIKDTSKIITELCSYAVNSLARMYSPEDHLFAFRLKKTGQTEILEGKSRRYTAIALIGLVDQNEKVCEKILGNHSLDEVCNYLIKDIDLMEDAGEIALTAWAARILKHKQAHIAIKRLKDLAGAGWKYSTVELSWALTSLVVDKVEPTEINLAKELAGLLMKAFNQQSAIFNHGITRKGLSAFSDHVSCFADFVYPVQALSYYYMAAQDSKAVDIACRCAEHMCELQGDSGQWWWHFDYRSGRVVERYPVYSVHQDSMAPMALLALEKACGKSYMNSIEKGLKWLIHSPEIKGSLIDKEKNIIWRKVARREPRKLVRCLNAAASRVHSTLRTPGMDLIFPPVAIDYESRPYHMGWILHAWQNM